jgi:hypothetical protein
MLPVLDRGYSTVVVTLGVAREPRSLVFRSVKHVLEADHETIIRTDGSPWEHSLSLALSAFLSPVGPVGPNVDQLWQQTGVKSERVPNLERVLRWVGWCGVGGCQVCIRYSDEWSKESRHANSRSARWGACEYDVVRLI